MHRLINCYCVIKVPVYQSFFHFSKIQLFVITAWPTPNTTNAVNAIPRHKRHRLIHIIFETLLGLFENNRHALYPANNMKGVITNVNPPPLQYIIFEIASISQQFQDSVQVH